MQIPPFAAAFSDIITLIHFNMSKAIVLLIVILLSAMPGLLSSQQLTPFVISSSGGFYSGNDAMLSFTVAEMSAVETFQAEELILTQGFQQHYDFGTGNEDHGNENFSFGILPNPTYGPLELMVEAPHSTEIQITIYDLPGRILYSEPLPSVEGLQIRSYDFSSLAQGTYILSLRTMNEHSARTYFKKFQIIRS